MRRQWTDVFGAMPKGRNLNRKCAHAIVEIAAKTAGRDIFKKGSVGGDNDSNVNQAGMVVSDPFEGHLLKRTQEFTLQLWRDLSNLVEEYRTPVCGFQTTFSVTGRTAERAFHVTEKLALEQVPRNRCTVDDDQRRGGATAPFMNSPGDKFFPNSGFAKD